MGHKAGVHHGWDASPLQNTIENDATGNAFCNQNLGTGVVNKTELHNGSILKGHCCTFIS